MQQQVCQKFTSFDENSYEKKSASFFFFMLFFFS